MSDTLSLALAQINPVVGDMAGNVARILAARAEAAALGADVVVLSELVVSGYPPEDLVLKPFFLDRVEAAVAELAAATADGGPALIAGAPVRSGEGVYNAALALDGGTVRATVLKHMLPNYGVFDEKRVFAAGPLPGPVSLRGARLGLMVCEDMWTPDVSECLEESGAEILVVVNGSPYETGKGDVRYGIAAARIGETGLPLVYVNQVGGQDELVFDGASFVLGHDRSLHVQLPAFEEGVALSRWRRSPSDLWICEEGTRTPPPEGVRATYQAMVLGLRDYVAKNRFPGVLLGLSGGIDSALTAAVAVDALGPGRVRCVMMPSVYTSPESLEDAEAAARLLGTAYDVVPIAPAVDALDGMLAPIFAGRAPDITEENIQSRLRGLILMALSNKLGHMLLSTGNKSEMSVGYATLYGDMNGGFNPLKDVYKTGVYALADWRNQARPPGALGPAGRVIPQRTIEKAPSAELRPNQTDQDSLPPYEALDDILDGLVEHELSVAEIVARGHDEATVNRVWRLLDRAEYKRRQAPPGVKLTARAFGRDRRYPITNAFTSVLG